MCSMLLSQQVQNTLDSLVLLYYTGSWGLVGESSHLPTQLKNVEALNQTEQVVECQSFWSQPTYILTSSFITKAPSQCPSHHGSCIGD